MASGGTLTPAGGRERRLEIRESKHRRTRSESKANYEKRSPTRSNVFLGREFDAPGAQVENSARTSLRLESRSRGTIDEARIPSTRELLSTGAASRKQWREPYH